MKKYWLITLQRKDDFGASFIRAIEQHPADWLLEWAWANSDITGKLLERPWLIIYSIEINQEQYEKLKGHWNAGTGLCQ